MQKGTAEKSQRPPVIMVLEDEFLIALQLETWLKSSGFLPLGPVPTVSAAEDLLDIVERPDAAVLDINLRGRSVLPIAEELEARRVPYIFVTGYDRAVLPMKFRDAPLLTKPVDMDKLISFVRLLIAA